MKLLTFEAFDTPLVDFVIASSRGATRDPIGREGLLSHGTELARRGAGPRNRPELDELVDSLGASLSVVLHRDYFYISGHCLGRHLRTLFGLAMDVLERPIFALEEHERLAREMQYELEERRDDDGALAHRFFDRFAHPGHPYSRTTSGTEESLRRITLDDSRDAYFQLFDRERALVAFSGAVTRTEADAVVSEHDFPVGVAGDDPELEIPEAPSGRRLVVVEKPERNQCSLTLGHVAPQSASRGYDLMRIAATAFGDMFSSRLNQEIRVRRGWSYDAHCSLYQGRYPAWLQISMSPTAEAAAAALARTLEMFEELVDKGLSAQEYDLAHSYLKGSEAFARATPRQRMHRAVRDAMMGRDEGHTGRFIERIALSTLDEVNAAIRDCLRPHQLTAVVVASDAAQLASLAAGTFAHQDAVDYRSY